MRHTNEIDMKEVELKRDAQVEKRYHRWSARTGRVGERKRERYK